MGGTTAKICLIDDGEPQHARTFEVARMYRFLKGSGLPLRIPVIEMVEIGAGGGSIARVDALQRITVGPDSAGAEPGPACYGRGGTAADRHRRRSSCSAASIPTSFAGGRIALDAERSRARRSQRGDRRAARPRRAAARRSAISEIVEENMANAARVHAIERGKDAARPHDDRVRRRARRCTPRALAEKLGIDRVLIPSGAGVGSAIGFLRAPVAYEVVRSRYVRARRASIPTPSTRCSPRCARRREADRRGAARPSARADRDAAPPTCAISARATRSPCRCPTRALDGAARAACSERSRRLSRPHYGRTIPGLDVEIMTWTLCASRPDRAAAGVAAPAPTHGASRPRASRAVYRSGASGACVDVPVYRRERSGARQRASPARR